MKTDNAMRDEALVKRFLAGDESAFTALHDEYYESVKQQAYQHLYNWSDAEDTANEVMFRVYRGLPRFRFQSTFYTWIYRVTHNLTINRYHWRNRRRYFQSTSLETPLHANLGTLTVADTLECPRPKPYEETEVGERESQLLKGMENLRDKHREILLLRNVEHKSYEEIAALLGVNTGTVKSRIARARDSLRECLA